MERFNQLLEKEHTDGVSSFTNNDLNEFAKLYSELSASLTDEQKEKSLVMLSEHRHLLPSERTTPVIQTDDVIKEIEHSAIQKYREENPKSSNMTPKSSNMTPILLGAAGLVGGYFLWRYLKR